MCSVKTILMFMSTFVWNVAYGRISLRQVCYPDVGCFSPANLFDALIFVPDSPKNVGTQFFLYTRNTQGDNFAILDYLTNSSLQGFDASKDKTFFITHGWIENSTTLHHVLLREALLAQFDANVIMVDWTKGAANLNYLQSSIDTQLVGRQIARLLQLLIGLNNLNVKNVHLIGLSLGGESNGFAGKWLKQTANNTVGRITGLDAAGVWFQLQKPEYHLAKTDADFVDAIHTCAGKIPIIGDFGILEPVGHVDFYVNGGRYQPRCAKWTNYFTKAYIFCSHEASIDYFTESIKNTCPFSSRPCPGISNQLRFSHYWKTKCNGPCQENCGRMGYYSNIAAGRGEQYLTTNDVSPYCQN